MIIMIIIRTITTDKIISVTAMAAILPVVNQEPDDPGLTTRYNRLL